MDSPVEPIFNSLTFVPTMQRHCSLPSLHSSTIPNASLMALPIRPLPRIPCANDIPSADIDILPEHLRHASAVTPSPSNSDHPLSSRNEPSNSITALNSVHTLPTSNTRDLDIKFAHPSSLESESSQLSRKSLSLKSEGSADSILPYCVVWEGDDRGCHKTRYILFYSPNCSDCD